MNIVNISRADIGNKYKYYNSGTESNLYRYNNDNLLVCFKRPNVIHLENIIKLSIIKNSIANTSLPNGIVLIDKCFGGYKTKEHKNSVSFGTFRECADTSLKIEKLLELKNNLKELTNNNIYLFDLDEENVLINTKTGKINIIDIASDYTAITEKENKGYLKKVLELYRFIVFETIINDPTGFYENLEEIFDKYSIDFKYIDIFRNKKYDYEFFDEFFNYIKKDKILMKSR